MWKLKSRLIPFQDLASIQGACKKFGTETLLAAGNFPAYSISRQLVTYAGIAPVTRRSGTLGLMQG